ncbi:MAG: hypothetical protein IJP82_00630 [Bacteroidaceae bacterium]|nr:hypothetical protein [Bacteroidaceae bacterium]
MKQTRYLKEMHSAKICFMLLFSIFSLFKANAQTDSVIIGNITEQFSKIQPLKVDMTNTPFKQENSTSFSPLFHSGWSQLFVHPVQNVSKHNIDADMRRAMMMPYWPTSMFDDVRVQPLFKIKSGKNSFSFGIGIDMDAVRRGIDIQRMEQRQQQMMNTRRW